MQEEKYGIDALKDYMQDATADAYAEWPADLAAVVGKPAEDPDVIKYREARETKWYATLEGYYARRPCKQSPYMSGGASTPRAAVHETSPAHTSASTVCARLFQPSDSC